jgi:hypothetical protein
MKGASTMVDVFNLFPPAIKVGPFRYVVEVLEEISKEDDGGAAWGDSDALVIRLKREQPSTAFALDTVLHEVGHAIAGAFALGDKSDEERAVSVFATGWTMVLQENPPLADWIWRALRNAV